MNHMNAKELLRKYNNGERGFFKANLEGADLSKADLRGVDLWASDLRGANLSKANLRGASLWGVDLRGADLWRANLRRADLKEACLLGADLMGADLEGVDLERADLSYVKVDNKTSLTVEDITKETKQVLLSRHVIWIGDEFIKIGCIEHPINYWVENYEEIGRCHGYSISDMQVYGKAIKKIKEISE